MCHLAAGISPSCYYRNFEFISPKSENLVSCNSRTSFHLRRGILWTVHRVRSMWICCIGTYSAPDRCTYRSIFDCRFKGMEEFGKIKRAYCIVRPLVRPPSLICAVVVDCCCAEGNLNDALLSPCIYYKVWFFLPWWPPLGWFVFLWRYCAATTEIIWKWNTKSRHFLKITHSICFSISISLSVAKSASTVTLRSRRHSMN